MSGLRFFSDKTVVDISASRKKPAFVRLYTRHAMMLVSTIFGVAHIERMGIGTDVSNVMITVTKLDIRVILKNIHKRYNLAENKMLIYSQVVFLAI